MSWLVAPCALVFQPLQPPVPRWFGSSGFDLLSDIPAYIDTYFLSSTGVGCASSGPCLTATLSTPYEVRATLLSSFVPLWAEFPFLNYFVAPNVVIFGQVLFAWEHWGAGALSGNEEEVLAFLLELRSESAVPDSKWVLFCFKTWFELFRGKQQHFWPVTSGEVL